MHALALALPLVSLAVGIAAWARLRPSPLRLAWSALTVALTVWLGSEAAELVGLSLPAHALAALGAAATLAPAIALHVALLDGSLARWSRWPLTWAMLYVPPIALQGLLAGDVFGQPWEPAIWCRAGWSLTVGVSLALVLVLGMRAGGPRTWVRWITSGVAAGTAIGMLVAWPAPSTSWMALSLLGVVVGMALSSHASGDQRFRPEGASAQLLSALPDALLVFDPAGRVAFANTVARSQFNVEPPAELAQLFRSRTEVDAFREGPWARCVAGVPRHGLEMTLQDRQSRPVSCSVSLSPLELEGTRSILLLAHDMTAIREIQAALAAAEKSIESGPRDGPWLHRASSDLDVLLARIAQHTTELAPEVPALPAVQSLADRYSDLRTLLTDVVDLSTTQRASNRESLDVIDLQRHYAAFTERVETLLTDVLVAPLDGPLPLCFYEHRLLRTLTAPAVYLSTLGHRIGPVHIAATRQGTTTTVRLAAPECAVDAPTLELALRGLQPTSTSLGHRFELALAKRQLLRANGSLHTKSGTGVEFVLTFSTFGGEAPVEQLPSESRTIWQ